jgi:esterase/lipase superfamily enzyme
VRDYTKEWSPALGRDMEVLRFGARGLPLLVFPTSMGRFYQWQDFGLVGALEDKIRGGHIQLFCVDSIDGESWYANSRHPRERIQRHLQYERYIVDEVVPRLPAPPVTTGTSFGATHALMLALRHSDRFSGFIGLSGAYDVKRWLDGYYDDDVYYTNPVDFLPGLWDEAYLGRLRGMERKVIATGRDDANVEESIRVGTLLNERGVGVWLDVWDGWAHDWPYWKEMIRRYV